MDKIRKKLDSTKETTNKNARVNAKIKNYSAYQNNLFADHVINSQTVSQKSSTPVEIRSFADPIPTVSSTPLNVGVDVIHKECIRSENIAISKAKTEEPSLQFSVYESSDGKNNFQTVCYSLSDFIKKFNKPSSCSTNLFANGAYLLGKGKDGGTCKKIDIIERSGLSFDLDKPNLSIKEATERLNSLGWVYIIHTTKSHTLEMPRYRVIVFFDKPVTTETKYLSLYQYAIEAIGFDKENGDDKSDIEWNKRASYPTLKSENQEYLLHINLDGSFISVSKALEAYLPKKNKKKKNKTKSAYKIPGLEGNVNEYFKDNWGTVLLEHTNNNSQNIQYFFEGDGGRYTYKDATPNSVEILPDGERIHCFNETFERDWGTKTMTAYDVLFNMKFDCDAEALADWASDYLKINCTQYEVVLPELSTKENGQICPTVWNLSLILSKDPDYSGLCGKNIYNDDALTLMNDHIIDEIKYSKGEKLKEIENSVVISLQKKYPTFTHMSGHIKSVLEHVSKKKSFTYCPFIDWIKARPWDGEFRVRKILTSMGAEDNVLNREILPLMMKQLIRRQMSPYEQNELSLVLIGQQDVGKTYLLKKLALEGIPDAPRGLLYTSFSPKLLNSNMDEANRKMYNKYIVVFNELELLSGGLLNSLKDLCSSTQIIGLRRMRRDAIDVPRRFILCATTNNAEIFDDTTGERRWVPVAVNIPIVKNDFLYNKMNSDFVQQVWAEVYAEYTEKEILNRLSADMKVLQEAAVSNFTSHDETLEGIILNYLKTHSLVSFALLNSDIKAASFYNVTDKVFGKSCRKLNLERKKLEQIKLSVYYDKTKIKDLTNDTLLKLHDKYLKGGKDDNPAPDGGRPNNLTGVISTTLVTDLGEQKKTEKTSKEPVIVTNQTEQDLLYLDFETYSETDLEDHGTDRYVNDPAFEPLLLSYALNGDHVQIIDFTQGEEIPQNIKDAIQSTSVTKIAFNDKFDKAVLRKIGFDIINWHDTSAHARLFNLPGKLARLGAFFKIQNQKLESGDALMKMFCMPRTKKGVLIRTLPTDNPEKWEEFKKYSKQDVAALRQCQIILDRDYPPVTATEKEIMKLDTEINERGVLVDLPCVHKILEVSENLTKSTLLELSKLTGLENPNSNPQITKWLCERGIETKSVAKEAVNDLLRRENLPDDVKQALLLHKKISTSSISKYKKMLDIIGSDNRLRGEFSYAGARTGRWKSHGVQLHNMPITLMSMEKLDVYRRGVEDVTDLRVFPELIRPMFIPAPGKVLVVVDASQIEARVTSWIPNEGWRLDVFTNGGDIYKESVATMYRIPVSAVSKEQRAIGKVAELALGYGGGFKAISIADKGKIIPDNQKEVLISKWRRENSKIVQAWLLIQNNCIDAYRNPDEELSWERLKFCYRSKINCLLITLPSGRNIVYPNFKYDPRAEGNKLTYYYDQRQQGTYGRNLFQNVIQAVSRDLLADYMFRVKKHNIVMHVHDEVVLEVPTESAEAVLKEALEKMREAPDWAKDLPLNGEGFICSYYRKG